MAELKTVLITQARTGSTRLPGKVLLKIKDHELLKIHISRLKESKKVDQIIVATTLNSDDDPIVALCEKWGVKSFRGSEYDVLDRFYQTVKDIKPKWIVRVTSDCPLIDADLIDAIIACAQVNEVDYCSNGLIEDFPDGQDVEVFKFSALEKAWSKASLKSEREHVTPFIRTNADINGGNMFKAINFPCAYKFNHVRMTVDEQQDFELIEKLIRHLGDKETWLTYAKYILDNNLAILNSKIIRNEGFLISLKNDNNG